MEHIVHYNKGCSYLSTKKYERAMKEFKKSISIIPTAEAYLNLGTVYKFLGRDSIASDCFRKALTTEAVTPGGIPHLAHTNLGLMKFVYDDDDGAIAHYDAALASRPDYADAAWNKSTALLRKACSGSHELFSDGWRLYDSRFLKTPPVTLKGNVGSLPIWSGQRDCRIIILAEQGAGDNIMFARFIPMLEEMYGVTCTLQGDTSLVGLLHTRGGFDFNYKEFDYFFPIGSICRFVGSISSAPYVSWNRAHDLDGVNIGVVWSGSPSHPNDAYRSCSVQRFKRFSKYGNLWSLNPGATDIPKWMNKATINNWEDTATWLKSMDLVITVDTSIAHLAGAMGVRTWMLQPLKETDFRWGSGNTAENVWYDSLDVYRNPNDWDFVFETVENDLKEIF